MTRTTLAAPADAAQTPWSDPGAHRLRLLELPAPPDGLPDALEGFVAHAFLAVLRGEDVPPEARGDRLLRRAERLLAVALARRPGPLCGPRRPEERLFVTCRDYALLATAALRARGVPARLRVGFASYLAPGLWEDHWICEHRTGPGWAVLDAQMGPRARQGLGLGFDVARMPPEAWRPAASTWRGFRRGEIDPARCGISFAGVSGPAFIAGALMRDAAALAGIELLPGDLWEPMLRLPRRGALDDGQARPFDDLAEALDPAPPDRAAALEVLARFPWARPGPAVRNVLDGPPGIEVRLDA